MIKIKLDYTIESPQERLQIVNQIIAETPNLNERYLEILSDYLIMCMDKQEKKNKKILTENRLVTVNKRETSFEGLAMQFENGEDGIYNLINEDKHTIFRPKLSITQKDIEDFQEIKQIREVIAFWKNKKNLSGRAAYVAKQAAIEFSKDQYIIKDMLRHTLTLKSYCHSKNITYLDGEEWVDADNTVHYSGVSLCDPKVCHAVLADYSRLKEAGYGVFDSDTYYLMEDFDRIATAALKDYPMYERLVEYKVDKMPNSDIQAALQSEFGETHSLEYLSTLWTKKIPALIASAAEDEILNWHYLNVAPGSYKKCNCCKKSKLAIPKYFSKNSASKDGFYSICKDCRAKKYKQKVKT